MVKKIGQKKIGKKVTCEQCGAILEYFPKDVKSQALYSMCEYDCTIYWVDCPECKNKVSVKG